MTSLTSLPSPETDPNQYLPTEDLLEAQNNMAGVHVDICVNKEPWLTWWREGILLKAMVGATGLEPVTSCV